MEFRNILGVLMTSLATLTGSYAGAQEIKTNLIQKSNEDQIFFIRETIGVVDVTIHSTSKEKLNVELQKFKEYWKSQKDLAEVLEVKKMTMFLLINTDQNGSNNIVSYIVEPYKAEDSEINRRKICVDHEDNAYVIRSSEEKSGLKKSSDCCNRISVKFQCVDKRKDKALSETFKHVMEIAGACKLPQS